MIGNSLLFWPKKMLKFKKSKEKNFFIKQKTEKRTKEKK
jgi:hypothetical protein